MGAAHTYAELESSISRLKGDLQFVVMGRLIADVTIIAGGEPRLRIGDHQLSEDHARRLAVWIQRVFKREEGGPSSTPANSGMGLDETSAPQRR